MHPFEYFAPGTLDEAVSLLSRGKGQARVIAGGTDLIIEIKEHIHHPDCLVDINKIEGLDDLSYDNDAGLKIGALTTVRTVEQAPIIKNTYPGLFQAVSQLGSVQIRNRATVAGNICRASPSADTPPPLIAAGAWVTIFGPSGEREIQLEEFFTGPGRTILGPDDILTAIHVPPPPPQTGRVYLKLGRRKVMSALYWERLPRRQFVHDRPKLFWRVMLSMRPQSIRWLRQPWPKHSPSAISAAARSIALKWPVF